MTTDRMTLDEALKDWETRWTQPRRVKTPEEIEAQRIRHEAETAEFAAGFCRLADLAAKKTTGEYLTTDDRRTK